MSQAIPEVSIKEVGTSKITKMLRDCELPTEDLNPSQSIFLGAFNGDILIGCIGLERLGEIGLLRSLAVHINFRGQGLGIKLAEVILRKAEDKSLDQVYLLTTDTEIFFKKLGFIKIIKNEAPDSVKKTKQYSEICSDSAVVMKIDL
ncbi:MAG: arsenic resistance N-acetyltransferase ArsN2 [Balneola sp.]